LGIFWDCFGNVFTAFFRLVWQGLEGVPSGRVSLFVGISVVGSLIFGFEEDSPDRSHQLVYLGINLSLWLLNQTRLKRALGCLPP
jgi:hypothetical protein